MDDALTPEQRSVHMSRIRGKDTKPELMVRRGLHERGYRYRLHEKSLPGRPDIVLKKFRAVVLVQGCFWHGHDCPLFKWPTTRKEWWREKIEENRARDNRTIIALGELGWRQALVWECALKGKHRRINVEVIDLLEEWLLGRSSYVVIKGDFRD